MPVLAELTSSENNKKERSRNRTSMNSAFAVAMLAGVVTGFGLGIKWSNKNNDCVEDVEDVAKNLSSKDMSPVKEEKDKKIDSTLCTDCGKMLMKAARAKAVYPGETLLQVLEKVSQKINPKNPDKIKECNKAVKSLIDDVLIEKLKSIDEIFSKLFCRIEWSGSYYDGLKINDLDEFDLNIVLSFPFQQDKVQVTTVNEETGEKALPGFVFVNNFVAALKDVEQHPDWNTYRKLEKWCNSKGSLLQTKVHQWFKGIMNKLVQLNKVDLEKKFGTVVLRESGPAMTLVFANGQLNIDLVPAFEFQTTGKHRMMPPEPFRQPFTDITRSWFIIPKPLKVKPENKGANYGADMWRLSFCCHEKDLISGKGRLKPAIKLIKKLRDSMDWPYLASYYIKTLFLWEVYGDDDTVDSDSQDSCDWNKQLDEVFMQMLERLLSCLEKKEIKFFWDRNCNLLEPMKSATIENMKFKLEGQLKKFKLKIEEGYPSYIGETIC